MPEKTIENSKKIDEEGIAKMLKAIEKRVTRISALKQLTTHARARHAKKDIYELTAVSMYEEAVRWVGKLLEAWPDVWTPVPQRLWATCHCPQTMSPFGLGVTGGSSPQGSLMLWIPIGGRTQD